MTEESFLIMLSISLIAIAWMVIAITYVWAYEQPKICPKANYPKAILI